MMQVTRLRLAYGTRLLCDDVSFTVFPGECLLLAGPNGSGKSTLLRAAAYDSHVALAPKRPTKRFFTSFRMTGWCHSEAGSPAEESTFGSTSLVGGASVGIDSTGTSAALIPTGIPKVKGFSVEEFVRTGCFRESDWAGRLNGASEGRLEWALQLLGLQERRGQDIATLSDGEFQKACIAAGLVRRAEGLLLDEPTAFLDVDNRLMVLQTLRDVCEKTGIGIIFSSHDLHDALRYAHRVLAFTPEGRFLESTPDNRLDVLQAAFPRFIP